MFGGINNLLYLCTRNSEQWLQFGSVAQLNRALDYGSRGCGFESRRSHTSIEDFTLSKILFFYLFGWPTLSIRLTNNIYMAD